MNLVDYGFTPTKYLSNETLQDNYIPARVIAVQKARYALVCEHGECFGCGASIRRKMEVLRNE